MQDLETAPADALRDALLHGLVREDELATALGVSRRTIQRLALPYVRIARHRLYDVAGSREKLRARRGTLVG